MDKKIKIAVEDYQCTGCISGHNISCFIESEGVGCGKHLAGTMSTHIGKFFLGMPKGFNRLGFNNELRPIIYESFEKCNFRYNMWNIPVWKYLSKDGHTFVRGLIPRLNIPFLHIFLEDCLEKIDCLEIDEKSVQDMD